METPSIRPGKSLDSSPQSLLVAFFKSSAMGNSAIQLLGTMGVSGCRLGVTTPDEIPGGQGMLLSIGCSDESHAAKVEAACRDLGAIVRRNPSRA